MRKQISIFIAACVPWFVSAQSVDVLGLPLGGKLGATIKKCPDDYKKRTALCWIDKPFKGKDGGLIGDASIPDASLPKWLAFHIPRLIVSPSGVLEVIRFPSEERLWRDRREIVSGVSQRFGAPREISYPGTYSATWSYDGAEIQLGCDNSKCFFDLLSKAEVDRVASARKKQFERPSSL